MSNTLSRADLDVHAASSLIDAPLSATTALDCDILTVVRDAQAHAQGARHREDGPSDPLDALYKPLANKDVACVLKATGR